MNITILGAGAWGTALAISFARRGYQVTLVTISQDHLKELKKNRENLTFLPVIKIPDTVEFSCDIPKNTDILLSCAPAQKIHAVCQRLQAEMTNTVPVVLCSKGLLMDPEKPFLTDIVQQYMSNPVLVLSGPNFAHEVARALPAASVLGCTDIKIAEDLAHDLSSQLMRIIPSDDIKGIQVAGSIKNIIAVANGIYVGRHLGANASAGLFVQGIREMQSIAALLGGKAETFSGLVGIGDLALTCSSGMSRNMSLGMALARGETLEAYKKRTVAVAEGAYTTQALHKIKGDLVLPVCDFVHDVLENKSDIDVGIRLAQLFNNPAYLQ